MKFVQYVYYSLFFYIASSLFTITHIRYCSAVYASMKPDGYHFLQKIGAGAQGQVWLVQEKSSNRHYALKQINKKYVYDNKMYANIFIERHVLANLKSPWIPKLYFAFQDELYLYFVMELVQGGDLMELLMRQDIIPEETAKFYLAEILIGLKTLHDRNMVHRDLKPDNILIDRTGHVKLTDFAMSANMNMKQQHATTYYTNLIAESKSWLERRSSDGGGVNADENVLVRRAPSRKIKRPTRPGLGEHRRSRTTVPRLQSAPPDSNELKIVHRRVFKSIVGTLDYIAPEMFESDGYTIACDLWSVGIIAFEMVFGHTPFNHDHQQQTLYMIRNWENYLIIPNQPTVSSEFLSFLGSLLCVHEKRHTVDQIMNHAFFQNVPWEEMRNIKPPFIPDLANERDTSYFPVTQVEEQELSVAPEMSLLDDMIFENFDYETFHR